MNQGSTNNFNRVAPIYDSLSQLVFGKSMARAQTFFLSEIRPGATVLILGGGTGWLLAELLSINPSCTVWYIEASSEMMAHAKRKVSQSGNAIHFIRGTEDSIPMNIIFDAVITHFYLDLFSNDSCDAVIQKIKSRIHTKTIWLVTDFIETVWWQRGMLALMYKFFRITCHIEAFKLPKWTELLERNEFTEVKSQFFFRRFIKSTMFLPGKENTMVYN